jgi:hypothetical protein
MVNLRQPSGRPGARRFVLRLVREPMARPTPEIIPDQMQLDRGPPARRTHEVGSRSASSHLEWCAPICHKTAPIGEFGLDLPRPTESWTPPVTMSGSCISSSPGWTNSIGRSSLYLDHDPRGSLRRPSPRPAFFQHDYPTLDDLRRGVPRLILAHNLHGIDIDLRATDLPPREIACPNG